MKPEITQTLTTSLLIKYKFFARSLFWLFQVVVVFLCGAFLGISTPHGSIRMDLSLQQLLNFLGQSDAGSYLHAGIDLATNNQNSPDWAWVLNLWPPGMVWVDGLLVKFSPIGFTWGFLLLLALLWGTVFYLISIELLSTVTSLFLVVGVELAVLASSPFQSWILDEGIFYADGLAAGFLILGLVVLIRRIIHSETWHYWLRDGVIVGIFLAASVFLRSSYQFITWGLAFTAVLIGTIVFYRFVKDSKWVYIKDLVLLLTSLVVLLSLVAPYTFYLLTEKDRFNLVTTDELFYADAWNNSEQDMPNWLVSSGASIGCDLDQVQCDLFKKQKESSTPPTTADYKPALFSAIAHHPLDFIQNRLRYFSQQWLGDEHDSFTFTPSDYNEKQPAPSNASLNQNFPQNLLYMGLLIATLYLSLSLAIRRGFLALFILPVFVIALLLPFGIVHIEVRYLIPLKLMVLLFPLLYVIAQKNDDNHASEESNKTL